MAESHGAGRVHVRHDEVLAVSGVVETSAAAVHDVAATVARLLGEDVLGEAAQLCPAETAELVAALEDVTAAVTATGRELEGVARLVRLCVDGYREVDEALARRAGPGHTEWEPTERSSYPLLDALLAYHDGGPGHPGVTLYDDPWLDLHAVGVGAPAGYEAAVLGLVAIDGLGTAG